MIHVICEKDSWTPFLNSIQPQQRFYSAENVDAALAETNGMPILIDVGGGLELHVYPPARTGDWARREMLGGRG